MKVKVSRKLDVLNSLVNQLKKSSDEIGAIAIFIGVVRGTCGEDQVLRLEYEVHKALALKVLKKIVRAIEKKHEVIDAIIEHRVGTINVGEEVMYVLIASKHREEGFQALTETVDRIKHELPIWKKEVTEKGANWVENL